MSVVSAPPRKDIYMLWGQYGAIGGARVYPRGRLWLLTNEPFDENAAVLCRIAWNHPNTGCVVYEDLGEIAQARIRPNAASAEVWLTSGGPAVTFITAPCVCGAGSVGNALPDEGRISLNYINPYNRPRIVFG